MQLMDASNGIKQKVRCIKFAGCHSLPIFYNSNSNEVWLHFLFQLLQIQVACGIGQHTVIGFGCNGVECGIEVHDGDFIFQTLAVQSNAKLRGSFLGSGHNTVQTILIISALQFQLESRTEQPCGITKATAIYIATTRNINQIVIVCGFTIRIESVGISERVYMVGSGVNFSQPIPHILLGAFGKFLISIIFIEGDFP